MIAFYQTLHCIVALIKLCNSNYFDILFPDEGFIKDNHKLINLQPHGLNKIFVQVKHLLGIKKIKKMKIKDLDCSECSFGNHYLLKCSSLGSLCCSTQSMSCVSYPVETNENSLGTCCGYFDKLSL